MKDPQMEISPIESGRIERGVNLYELARRTGIPHGKLRQHIESPEEMTLSEISSLAAELRSDVMDLVGRLIVKVAT